MPQDEEWKKSVDDEVKKCNIEKARLQDKDEHQQKEIDLGWKERQDLYTEKNAIKDRVTIVETDKVGSGEFNKLKTCVSNLKILLKTERKFLPWIAMIISILAGLATLVFIISRMSSS
ncbi:MAG: hypothetical protein GY774_16525 [Planctomycetes bacterium]|nr:hypothetical protein [Planctomycetota bacterium]